MGTFSLISTPVSCFDYVQASLTRLLMSFSVPPFESTIDHKYLNVVIVLSLSSPSCMNEGGERCLLELALECIDKLV